MKFRKHSNTESNLFIDVALVSLNVIVWSIAKYTIDATASEMVVNRIVQKRLQERNNLINAAQTDHTLLVISSCQPIFGLVTHCEHGSSVG